MFDSFVGLCLPSLRHWCGWWWCAGMLVERSKGSCAPTSTTGAHCTRGIQQLGGESRRGRSKFHCCPTLLAMKWSWVSRTWSGTTPFCCLRWEGIRLMYESMPRTLLRSGQTFVSWQRVHTRRNLCLSVSGIMCESWTSWPNWWWVQRQTCAHGTWLDGCTSCSGFGRRWSCGGCCGIWARWQHCMRDVASSRTY